MVPIRVRRGTAAEWAAKNPILAAGELGEATDTRVLKAGDGVTAWVDLPGHVPGTSGMTLVDNGDGTVTISV